MDVVFACETKCKHLDALRMLFIHNTKADRFGVDFMRPYRASHVKIKVLPPKETSMNETKEGGQAATTATASRSNFTSYLTRKTSAVFSSSSTRHKNKKRHQTPKNNGVGSSQPGCPPSPAMASGAPPTEHSESSRGEDEDEGANMVSVQPNDPSIQAPNRSRFRDREASPRVISGEDSDMGLMPQVESEINDALNTGEDSLDSESGQRVFTFISGRRFGRYRNRHEKAERRELRMKEKAAAVAAMAAVDKDINEHSNMHYCSDDAEGAGDCEISRAPSLKPDSFSHMWIDTENMNALWNIDGEICESNVLTLEPQCQFVSFFGARPPPPPSALHSKGGKQRGGNDGCLDVSGIVGAEAVVATDHYDLLQKRRKARKRKDSTSSRKGHHHAQQQRRTHILPRGRRLSTYVTKMIPEERRRTRIKKVDKEKKRKKKWERRKRKKMEAEKQLQNQQQQQRTAAAAALENTSLPDSEVLLKGLDGKGEEIEEEDGGIQSIQFVNSISIQRPHLLQQASGFRQRVGESD